MLTIKSMCDRGVPVFSGRFPSHPDRRRIPYRVVFDSIWWEILPVYPTASSWSPICGADWQCSAVRLGGALSYIGGGGTWVKSAVVLMLLSAELFFLPLSPWTGFTATSQSRVSPQWRLCTLRLLRTVSDVGAEMWDAAWRDSLIEAKLWHGHHRRKRSRN